MLCATSARNCPSSPGALAARGYGLTLGVHSRLQRFLDSVREAVPAGNTYVNRNMTGAVVGVQPFGGEGPVRDGPESRGAALSLTVSPQSGSSR